MGNSNRAPKFKKRGAEGLAIKDSRAVIVDSPEPNCLPPATATVVAENSRPEARQVWMAIAPYLIIIAVFSLAQIPFVKTWLAQVGSVTFAWPGLDITDSAGKPVTGTKFKLDHVYTTYFAEYDKGWAFAPRATAKPSPKIPPDRPATQPGGLPNAPGQALDDGLGA